MLLYLAGRRLLALLPAGWQETFALVPAGWQETFRSAAIRLAGDLALVIQCISQILDDFVVFHII